MEKKAVNTYFIIGAKGQLGKTFQRLLLENNIQPVLLERAVYQGWWHEKSVGVISRFFEKFSSQEDYPVILNASGLINPIHNEEEHLKINFLLAKHLIEGGTRIGCRVVTMGTILEKVLGNDSSNSYVFAKSKLGEFVNNISMLNKLCLHIRIHTLYGMGLPHSFMFLGQIFNALRFRTVFNMSPGNQLREYHHIEDDAKAILKLIQLGQNGVFELNHGEPITLGKLAHFIFDKFNCLDLLKIAGLPAPQKENYEWCFEKPPSLSKFKFRCSLSSIVDYLETCLKDHNK